MTNKYLKYARHHMGKNKPSSYMASARCLFPAPIEKVKAVDGVPMMLRKQAN